MAIYDFKCDECESVLTNVIMKVADLDHARPACCDRPMSVLISAPPMGHVKNFDYRCPVTGQQVTTLRQRKNIMAEHNLRDANGLAPPPKQPQNDDPVPGDLRRALRESKDPELRSLA